MRVEIVPYNHPKDDATPSIDVCINCIGAFNENDFLPEEIFEQYNPESRIGSIDCDHPPYQMKNYKCELCGKLLTVEDN